VIYICFQDTQNWFRRLCSSLWLI